MKTKEEIRKETIGALEKQGIDERIRKSRIIKKKLFSSDEFKKAKLIMFYVSTDFEVDTKEMIDDALKAGKKIAVPYVVCGEKKMLASLIKNRLTDLVKGPLGIYQPGEKAFTPVDISGIDLLVVPGVAFDRKLCRLGRGLGYYDKFLKQIPEHTPTIGIAFGIQIVENLPCSGHDVPVKKLITD